MSIQENTATATLVTNNISFYRVIRSEWRFWLIGALFSFFCASILMSGWPSGLIPNISSPYVSGGDAAFTDWVTQRLIEGWVFNNPRSGYPFGSSFLDYPGSDLGCMLLLKILGMVTGKYYAAINLFFLLGFPMIVISSFITLRLFNLNPWLSLSASLIYAFSPFHFLRIGHLFFTWYFVVPIFFYIAFKIFNLGQNSFKCEKTFRVWSLLTLIILTLSSFGIYYALFGIIVIGVAGISGSISKQSYRNIGLSIGVASAITLAVIGNLSPNIANNYFFGKNPDAVVRSNSESEIYGFKLMQLLLPQPNHHIEAFAKKTAQYSSSTPLVNENATSSLGLIGALGFLLAGVFLVRALSGRQPNKKIGLFTLMAIALFLFGTIGGLGSLFSNLITTSIRGWNRISIFISFAAVSTFFLSLQLFLEKHQKFVSLKFTYPTLSILLVLFGLYDQTSWACKSCNLNSVAAFKLESEFINRLESLLPKGSALYQLPYISFPEVPPLFRLSTYEQATGFTNSQNLRWSYGGMKGREGDLFFKSLSKESLEKQIEVVQRLGFSGIYIDRRGYSDNGKAVISELTNLIGEPLLTRRDGEIVVFQIKPSVSTDISNFNYSQIIEKVGYSENLTQYLSHQKLSNGISFKKESYPEFIQFISGIDAQEDWGRWSNSNLSRTVKLQFNQPLPKKFSLELQAIAFGPNANLPTSIVIGKNLQKIAITNENGNIYRVVFNNPNSANTIEIIPPKPTSPHNLNPESADNRKLGVGLISLKIKDAD